MASYKCVFERTECKPLRVSLSYTTVKREQGKHLGWAKIKREILKAIIDGHDTREKLKDLFAPNIVTRKDIDYHLWGTPDKPGLIRKGVLKEKDGHLIINLRNYESLEEILKDYLLGLPEYRMALDLEFSTCYLSQYGDFLLLRFSSREELLTLRDYHDWANGYRSGNDEGTEQRIIEFAEKKSGERRGSVGHMGKMSYIVAFYSLVSCIPSEEGTYDNPGYSEAVGNQSTSELTLAWKDMGLIHEMAKGATNEIIKAVFERLNLIAKSHKAPGEFIGAKLPELGIYDAASIIGTVMYAGIDELFFDAGLFAWITTPGRSSYAREIIKIMKSVNMISVKDLDSLGAILKSFNDSQPEEIKYLMADTEKLLEKYHGKANS